MHTDLQANALQVTLEDTLIDDCVALPLDVAVNAVVQVCSGHSDVGALDCQILVQHCLLVLGYHLVMAGEGLSWGQSLSFRQPSC